MAGGKERKRQGETEANSTKNQIEKDKEWGQWLKRLSTNNYCKKGKGDKGNNN